MSACNIDRSGVTKRTALGIVFLALAVGLCLGLVLSGESRWMRLTTLPCFFVAALCLLQAREKV